MFFAALWALTAFLLTRGRLAGVVSLGVLSLIEAAFVPFLTRTDTSDWAIQILELVLGLVGLVLTFLLIRARRAKPTTA